MFQEREDRAKRIALLHNALLRSKASSISRKGNRGLRAALIQHGDLERVFSSCMPECIETLLEKDDILANVAQTLQNSSVDPEVVTINDFGYPTKLKCYPDAAPILYFKGDLSLPNLPTIAVIGTRELDEERDVLEGRNAVERLIRGEKALALTRGEGYCIVSGLASGSDTLAHREAIAQGGRTIAVLGFPLDRYYPKENRALQDHIGLNQLLFSQYPIGFSPFKGSGFVERNYTVACLSSEGVLVIHAGDKSGTQHAIKHCWRQNKPLYALRSNQNQGYDWVEKNQERIKFI